MDLPQLPLTGIYVDRPCPGRYPDFDQALMFCADCGHAQLLNAIDPDYLYVQTYSHRSSSSDVAMQGNDFFYSFLERIAQGRNFKAVVEVGCNDLDLLKKLQSKGERLFGIDPIWRHAERPRDSKITVIGKFIEEVDLEKEIEVRPDLVISAHTFEHMDDPRSRLEDLIRFADKRALFVIAVPAFDSLLRVSRFDQVFHQHVQYFSVVSLRRLIEELGGRYLTHAFNYQCWNGTLLMAFCKDHGTSHEERSVGGFERTNPEKIRRRVQEFKERMAYVSEFVHKLEKPVYGYGAAQMVPVLAYHLKSDLGFLECILDDDPRREGLCYPALAVKIRRPWPEISWDSASVMITALDSARPIAQRLLAVKPRYFFAPIEVW